jgi:predicted site-specific integrase-resolvase
VALYARVSSHDQKADAQRQLERLRDYAAARGYQVTTEVVEIACGLNDQRPKFSRLLSDTDIQRILVEHKDRATRFGCQTLAAYIALLLQAQGRQIEVINETDTQDELVDDFVSLITAMAARIYGRRSSRQRSERIRACVEQVYQVEG